MAIKPTSAAQIYKALNGIICLYKPSCVAVPQILNAIKTKLCEGLNALPDRPLEQRVEIVGPSNAPLSVQVVPNLADHPLACGPRYMQEDFRTSWAGHIGLFSSGVLLLGINDGTKVTRLLQQSHPTRAYKIHGQLGKATDTYFWNGRTMERSTYSHVTRAKLDTIVAHMQSAHQKTVYEILGVHMESQTAYDLASQGVIRPANSKLPVIYGIKCVYFNSPNLILEVQAVNEYDKYLWTLVHDLGVQLKTSAFCTGVQCIRLGKFDLELALLRKHWKLDFILENMQQCQEILDKNEQLLYPESAKLSA